jgi:hypothetical protein
VKETSPLPRCAYCDLRPPPLVVQFSDSRWTTAPHLPLVPDHANHPDQSDLAPPAKDDVVGWPHGILIDSTKVPDRTLDSAANTLKPRPLWIYRSPSSSNHWRTAEMADNNSLDK